MLQNATLLAISDSDYSAESNASASTTPNSSRSVRCHSSCDPSLRSFRNPRWVVIKVMPESVTRPSGNARVHKFFSVKCEFGEVW